LRSLRGREPIRSGFSRAAPFSVGYWAPDDRRSRRQQLENLSWALCVLDPTFIRFVVTARRSADARRTHDGVS
jgi:hypothetical protein